MKTKMDRLHINPQTLDDNSNLHDSFTLAKGDESQQPKFLIPNSDNENFVQNKMSSQEKTFLFHLFIFLFIDLLSFTIILPLLPSILDIYKSSDTSGLYRALENLAKSLRRGLKVPDLMGERVESVLIGGIVGSLYSFMQFLSAPILGASSDHFGRRPILLLTLLGSTFSYILWVFNAKSFGGFILARIILGLCKGNVSLCLAMISDVFPEDKRARAMMIVGFTFAAAFTFGPLLGVSVVSRLLRESSSLPHAAATVSVAFSSLATSLGWQLMTESILVENRSKCLLSGISSSGHLVSPPSLFSFTAVSGLNALTKRQVKCVGLIYFLNLFCYSGLEFNLGFLMYNRFGYTIMQQGRLMCFIGIVMSLFQAVFSPRIKSGNERQFCLFGLLACIPAFLIVAVASSSSFTSNAAIYFGLALYAFPSAVVVPCLTSMASSYGNKSQRGTLLGIIRSLGSLARALGPLTFSGLYWLLGPEFAFSIGAVSFLFPAGILVLTGSCKNI